METGPLGMAVPEGYEALAELGRGGMGTVISVRNLGTGGVEAMKVLHADIRATPGLAARFQREYNICRRLGHHPHIVEIYRCSASGAHPWLTMQLVSGGDGASLVPGPGQEPDLGRVLATLTQIADALDYAHGHGVIHRDVKPSNFLLDPGEPVHAYLTDFGIAQFWSEAKPAAGARSIVGSLPYSAPEIFTGTPAGPAADQYSLACAAVEMLSGHKPFRATTPFTLAQAHLRAQPELPARNHHWIPPAVDVILGRGLAKSAGERYGQCAEMIAPLLAVLDGVLPPPEVPRRHHWWSR